MSESGSVFVSTDTYIIARRYNYVLCTTTCSVPETASFLTTQRPSVPMRMIQLTPGSLHSMARKDYPDHAHAPQTDRRIWRHRCCQFAPADGCCDAERSVA